jgi:hypothetical protein
VSVAATAQRDLVAAITLRNRAAALARKNGCYHVKRFSGSHCVKHLGLPLLAAPQMSERMQVLSLFFGTTLATVEADLIMVDILARQQDQLLDLSYI